jgi:hypothetical protein
MIRAEGRLKMDRDKAIEAAAWNLVEALDGARRDDWYNVLLVSNPTSVLEAHQELISALAKDNDVCVWTFDMESDVYGWDTGCDWFYHWHGDNLSGNEFCMYCGKRIQEEKTE